MEPTYIPYDISEYEEKIYWILSARQLFWGIIALVSGVMLYCVGYLVLKINQDICIYLTIIISFALFWMGWSKWQGRRPYSDKIKAILEMKRKNQRVFYMNNSNLLLEEGYNAIQKKTRKDKRINKQECREF